MYIQVIILCYFLCYYMNNKLIQNLTYNLNIESKNCLIGQKIAQITLEKESFLGYILKIDRIKRIIICIAIVTVLCSYSC